MKCRILDGSGEKTNWKGLALEARKGSVKKMSGRRAGPSLKQGTLKEEHFEGEVQELEHVKRKGHRNLNTDLNS